MSKRRVVFITGGASGIGLATSKMFIKKEEAHVFILDLAREAEITAHQIGAVRAFVGDATDDHFLLQCAQEIHHHFGRLDVLVNNVGISMVHSYGETDIPTFDLVMKVNVRSAFVATEAMKNLLAKEGGAIVNISSTASKLGDSSAMYAASKAAILGLTRYYARHLAPDIRVNTVAPGGVGNTGIDRRRPKERREMFAKETPLGRLATPEEIAAAIYFLASPEASYITGECLDVNGGLVMD